MRSYFKLLLIICLITKVNIFWASDYKQELKSLLDQFKSLEANFVQKTYDDDDDIVQQTKGSFALVKPNKFFWNSVGDNTFLLIVDGKNIWNYEPELEQVVVKNLKTLELQKFTPLKILLMGTKVLDDFLISKTPQNCFILRSKKELDNYIDVIKLCFTDNKITKINFYDNLGNNTDLLFSNIKMDGEIKAAKFVFNPPPNTDIIKE